MDAGKKSISDIFNQTRILEIPFFQRAYVWGNDQWGRFLDDMKHISQNPKPYFFGSVILKQQPRPPSQNVGDVRFLIDGQQRLTTLIIFFKTISLMNQKYSYLYERFLLQKPPHPLALLHNHNDVQSFQKVCDLKVLGTISDKEAKNDNILSSYRFFEENIDINALDVDAIDNNLMLVSIDVHDGEDEQQIFDTINSLGVRLTTAELLKNYFFSRDEITAYEEKWKSIFEKDDETKQYWDREISVGRLWRTFLDLFFYAYLQIKVQEPALKVSGKDKENFSRVEDLFQSYKDLIKNYSLNKSEIIGEIKEYAETFSENFDYEIIKDDLPAEAGIKRINAIIWGLETSTLIPYTLFILKNVKSDKERDDLFGSIESYVMRRMVVRANIKNYNQLFSDRMIGNRVLSKVEFQNQIQKRGDQVNFLPTDAELKAGFTESKLVNKQAAGILYFIESKNKKSEQERDKHATRVDLRGISQYSLEHLMPKKWDAHWGQVADQDEKDERNRMLLTMGNLAIIPKRLNASLKNSAWKTKKEALSHYASRLTTLHDCLQTSDWNEREIEKRAEYLCEKAIEVWPFK